MTDTSIEQQHGSALAISGDQASFTPEQKTILSHMGLGADVPDPDLKVFFHQCQRTGLDPFAKQIYMILRKGKYTIQTGIDGYRLMGHRAAAQRGEDVAIEPYEWMDGNGNWRPVWSKKWGEPLAARVTIVRAGNRFTAIANFDEYVQLKSDGGVTQMWATRPAGQIAKCAEALAWRMAFPQDMAGIYTDDEMGQADNPAGVTLQRGGQSKPKASASLFSAPAAEVVQGHVVPDEGRAGGAASPESVRGLFEAFDASAERDEFTYPAKSDVGKRARMQYMSEVLGREVTGTDGLSVEDVAAIVDALHAGPQR